MSGSASLSLALCHVGAPAPAQVWHPCPSAGGRSFGQLCSHQSGLVHTPSISLRPAHDSPFRTVLRKSGYQCPSSPRMYRVQRFWTPLALREGEESNMGKVEPNTLLKQSLRQLPFLPHPAFGAGSWGSCWTCSACPEHEPPNLCARLWGIRILCP